jgi:hypothetical protein
MTSPRRATKRGLHWPGVVGVLTTLAGLVQLPEVALLLHTPQLVKPGVAVIVVAIGAAIQSLTRPVTKERAP